MEIKTISGKIKPFNKNGKLLIITGMSGAGKSTIARIICGLIRPEYGDIYFKKKENENE